ncbi:hypothetical protein AAVH_39695, partial [Aphelenchoides avenae]
MDDTAVLYQSGVGAEKLKQLMRFDEILMDLTLCLKFGHFHEGTDVPSQPSFEQLAN